MTTLGDNIKKRRLELGLDQVDLAKLCGWSNAMRVSYYERNERYPKRNDIIAIAKALKISPQALEWGSVESNANILPVDQIPVITSDMVKKNPDFDILIKNKSGTISMTGNHPRLYALKVYDNSMTSPLSEKSLFIGDHIIIDPDKTPENNDLIIIKYNNSSDFFIKQFIKEGSSIRLISFDSTRYPPLELNETIEICGVIIQRLSDFRK